MSNAQDGCRNLHDWISDRDLYALFGCWKLLQKGLEQRAVWEWFSSSLGVRETEEITDFLISLKINVEA